MHITYHVGPHDGGFAYQLDGAWSETFSSHDVALDAAKAAAQRQQVEGKDARITFQLPDASWVTEYVEGGDRPEADVIDG